MNYSHEIWQKKHRWAVGVGIMVLAFALILTGCSQQGGQESAAKPELVLADLSWDSVQVHNRVAGFILENGYGFPVKYTMGESLPILQGLGRGDVNILMEMWIENYQEVYDKLTSEGKIKDLGPNFIDAPQGWYVPTFMIKGDQERGIAPMAPDLKSVSDLPKYWELFKDPEVKNKGRFYNGAAGWVVTGDNAEKLKLYGLDKYYNNFIPGSDAALSASMVAAYEKGQPWLGYYWEPTWVMGMLDMTLLEEPPYSKEQWEKDKGCAFAPSKVNICINSELNSELEKTAPEVIEFLKKYETTLAQNNKILAYMKESESDTQGAAMWFLKQYPDVWKSWVTSEAASRVEKAIK